MFYQIVTEQDFLNAFRSIRPDNFSTLGLRALFDHLGGDDYTDLMELDVIAICCEYCEYSSIEV